MLTYHEPQMKYWRNIKAASLILSWVCMMGMGFGDFRPDRPTSQERDQETRDAATPRVEDRRPGKPPEKKAGSRFVRLSKTAPGHLVPEEPRSQKHQPGEPDHRLDPENEAKAGDEATGRN